MPACPLVWNTAEVRDHLRCSCLSMSRQALAQSRHAFAHFCMCASSGVFAQAAAQMSQAFTQDSHIVTAIGPCRETILAAAPQNSAQSAQVCTVVRCAFFPEAT